MKVTEVNLYESNNIAFCNGYVRAEASSHLTKCDIACGRSLPSLMCGVDATRTGVSLEGYCTYVYATSSISKCTVSPSWYIDSENNGTINLIDRYYVYELY